VYVGPFEILGRELSVGDSVCDTEIVWETDADCVPVPIAEWLADCDI
jgi:hypothetical protein